MNHNKVSAFKAGSEKANRFREFSDLNHQLEEKVKAFHDNREAEQETYREQLFMIEKDLVQIYLKLSQKKGLIFSY